jgi:hypothetical protein
MARLARWVVVLAAVHRWSGAAIAAVLVVFAGVEWLRDRGLDGRTS